MYLTRHTWADHMGRRGNRVGLPIPEGPLAHPNIVQVMKHTPTSRRTFEGLMRNYLPSVITLAAIMNSFLK